MMFNTEQFTAAGKANLDAAVEIGQKAFGGIEKLVELNLQVTRAALDESAAHAKALLAVKDPQELLALQSGALQPAAEKATAYGRQVYEIASSTQADISKLLEAQAAGAQEKFQGFVEAAMKNAPAGSENAVAMMKQAMSATSAAVESAQKAAKQAVSSAEANIQSITKAAKAA
ncbi:MAG: phasin family protein [Sphaerotilus sp.]|nr:phasin family protein [Sphaerotilus sp.]